MAYSKKSLKDKDKPLSKRKQEEKDLQERLVFLAVYDEFNKWLRDLGFNPKISSTAADYDYGLMDSLHSVECYVHEGVKYVIRFVRGRNKHEFMFIGAMTHSKLLTLDEMKEAILKDIRHYRDEMLQGLEAVMSL